MNIVGKFTGEVTVYETVSNACRVIPMRIYKARDNRDPSYSVLFKRKLKGKRWQVETFPNRRSAICFVESYLTNS